MAVRIDHLALAARDAHASARFTIDYAVPPFDFPGQHVAFLVGEDDVDGSLARLQQRGITYWADPGQRRAGRYDGNHGGRGLYVDDPGGRHLEVLTRRYGSGG